MTALSVLDLSPIVQGGDARQALNNSASLAQHAQRLGYHRYWVAEHHNMKGIASAATSVVIGHIAASTETIRVGAGGIMLPNHAPLMVAEQFASGLVVDSAFDSESPLAHRRKQVGRPEHQADAISKLKTSQPGFRQYNRVVLAVIEFLNSRVDVASNFQDLQIRAHMEQLCLATWASGAHSGCLRKLCE